MVKKGFFLVISLVLIVNSYGCVALLAAGAGAGGTALWLNTKITKDVNSTYDRSINAVKAGLKSLDLVVTKETRKDEITQIKSQYFDGKTIWVDVRKTTPQTSRIEVRVGGLESDELSGQKIMDKILRYL